MKTLRSSIVAMAVFFALAGSATHAQQIKGLPKADKQAVESGKGEAIDFLKDLNKAMELSAKDGRPVIVYFTFDT